MKHKNKNGIPIQLYKGYLIKKCEGCIAVYDAQTDSDCFIALDQSKQAGYRKYEPETAPMNMVIKFIDMAYDLKIRIAVQTAIVLDNVNEAVILIMQALGQNSGNIAGIYFSNHEELPDGNLKEWLEADQKQRTSILNIYVELEKTYAKIDLKYPLKPWL